MYLCLKVCIYILFTLLSFVWLLLQKK
jgi:hypothetical protein